MKKKYLGLFIADLKSLSQKIFAHKLEIEKICENFEKLFIINTENLRFFPNKKNLYNKKDFLIDKKNLKIIIKNKNLKIPSNIVFFNPLNVNDFKNFMIDKDIVAINSFGRSFNELKIHFLLKKYNIKQVQLANVGNIQTQIVPVKNIYLKSWIYKFNHDIGHKITIILSNLGIIPKIDFRFISNAKILQKLKAKGLVNHIFKKFNLYYCKKHILVNSKSYDYIFSKKPIISEEKIVFLDIMFDHPERLAMGSKPNKKTTKEFYFKIIQLLKYLSKSYKKKVIICLHPKDNLFKKKKIFKNFEVVKYSSQKNIFKSFIVIFFDTSAIVDALILKKRLIVITSDAMDKNQLAQANDYHNEAGILKIDLDKINLKNLKNNLKNLNKSREKYSSYTKKYINPDGKKLGYEKIIKTIKRNFFN